MEKQKLRNNLVASGIFVAFSAFMVFYAISHEISVKSLLGSSMSSIDSRLFPYITSAFIGVLALVEFAVTLGKYLRLGSGGADQTRVAQGSRGILLALGLFGLFAGYAVLFRYFGFIAATSVVPPVVLFVMGSRKWYHYASFYVVAAITYILFVHALNIAL